MDQHTDVALNALSPLMGDIQADSSPDVASTLLGCGGLAGQDAASTSTSTPTTLLLTDTTVCEPFSGGVDTKEKFDGFSSQEQLLVVPTDVSLKPEDEPAVYKALASVQNKRRLMWILLFCFTIFNGMTSFFFRLQVVMADKDEEGNELVLSSGTFLFCLVVGEVLPLAMMSSYQMGGVSGLPSKSYAIIGFLAGALNMSGMIGFMIMNQEGGEASVLAPLTSLNLIVPVLFGVFYFKDKMTSRRAIGITVGVGATMMFALGGGSLSLGDSSTLPYFVLCFFSWGCCTALFQLLSSGSSADLAGGYVGNSLGFVTMGLIGVFGVFSMDVDASLSMLHVVVMLGGLCHALGNIFFVLLSKTMPEEASVVAPLCSLYVLWPIMLGMFVLGETVTVLKICGIVAAITAVLLMGVKDFGAMFASCARPAVAVLPLTLLPYHHEEAVIRTVQAQLE